jgi:hypothetical protein
LAAEPKPGVDHYPFETDPSSQYWVGFSDRKGKEVAIRSVEAELEFESEKPWEPEKPWESEKPWEPELGAEPNS